MSIPERVFIQIPDESGYGQFSWDEGKIDETDIEYSRITLEELAALRRVAEAARAAHLPNHVLTFNELCELYAEIRNAVWEYDKCRAA